MSPSYGFSCLWEKLVLIVLRILVNQEEITLCSVESVVPLFSASWAQRRITSNFCILWTVFLYTVGAQKVQIKCMIQVWMYDPCFGSEAIAHSPDALIYLKPAELGDLLYILVISPTVVMVRPQGFLLGTQHGYLLTSTWPASIATTNTTNVFFGNECSSLSLHVVQMWHITQAKDEVITKAITQQFISRTFVGMIVPRSFLFFLLDLSRQQAINL